LVITKVVTPKQERTTKKPEKEGEDNTYKSNENKYPRARKNRKIGAIRKY